MRYEKSCGTFTIHNGKVLLIEARSGNIGLPKGHVEENETEEQTAIRETKEETNIDVKIIPNTRIETSYPQGKNMIKTVVYFLATTDNEDINPQLEELNKAFFVEYNKVNDLLSFNNMKEIYKQVLVKIKELNL